MVLDIIGENHRTRYGIKEEFHMTEECAMYLCEGIQTMNKIIEKLEKEDSEVDQKQAGRNQKCAGMLFPSG